MECDIIDTGMRTARENMELDRALLGDLEHTPVIILHLYEWERPSATYGHFIKPEEYLKESDLDLAQRPTGGGIVFHTTDFAFSVLVPKSHPAFSENTLENYAFVNNKVIEALGGGELLPVEPEPLDEASKSFCMAKPTKYDVMMEGRKVGGAAQRRTKHGYLHQGTIFLERPSDAFLDSVLLEGTRVREGMAQNSYPLKLTKEEVKQRLIKVFQG
ncbi:MAG: hypothetical protein H7A36_03125 [Chlamydiales bacterium]|nr:hypothetical protein [Chlamydiales bacterium]